MIGSPPIDSLDDVQRLRAGTAVSWGAIFAGAAVAVATSAVLFALGAGLGFASISPWANRGASATTFAISGAIWLIVTQWLSAALGGYIAGRLRHRWLATHQHEVFFRDTAHGFVTWSVATIAVVLLAGASLGSVSGGAARAGAAAAGMGMRGMAMHGMMDGASAGPMGSGPAEESMYAADKLFRGAAAAPPSAMAMAGPGAAMSGPGAAMTGPSAAMAGRPMDHMDPHMEVMHIAGAIVASGDISAEDRAYLATLVASRTGASTDEAQKRVDAFVAQVKDTEARAKAAADAARKAAAQTAIYIALAMILGAFIASVSAAIGGRLRDEHL
jgi:hypothetical protein